MSKHQDLLKKVAVFERMAADMDLKGVLAMYKNMMQREISGCISACTNLINTNPDAKNSTALQEMDENLGSLAGIVYGMNEENYQSVIDTVQGKVNGLLFFTSPQNAGTGYQAITNIGGNNSPAAFMNRLNSDVKALALAVKKFESKV